MNRFAQPPRFSLRASHRRAFTLIELLTVIAVIGILVAILVPVVGKVRSSARGAKCSSNLRQVGIGALAFANEFKGLVPHGTYSNILPEWVAYKSWDETDMSSFTTLVANYVLSGSTRHSTNIGTEEGSVTFLCPSGKETVMSNGTRYQHYGYRTRATELLYGNGFSVRRAAARAGQTVDLLNIRRLPNPALTILAADWNAADLAYSGSAPVEANIQARHDGRINFVRFDASVGSLDSAAFEALAKAAPNSAAKRERTIWRGAP